jgi:hypothetical protein
MNSSGMGGACEVGELRRSHHICKSVLQLFDIALIGEEWRREWKCDKMYVE